MATSKFSDVVNRTMSPESQERAKQKTQHLLGEMALDELRAALSLTQQNLAETLRIKQSSVSKVLHGQDMYLSTLDKILQAMGGELEVYVALPDGRIKLSLNQFRTVAKEAEIRTLKTTKERAERRQRAVAIAAD
jgi:plasmid maintenance system antidote protein VapI